VLRCCSCLARKTGYAHALDWKEEQVGSKAVGLGGIEGGGWVEGTKRTAVGDDQWSEKALLV
jgi:hypothetical protein